MLFLFVGGGSGSGKSEISKQVKLLLEEQGYNIITITMDNYYKPRPVGTSSEEFVAKTNFDVPEALDLHKLRDHLNNLGTGKKISQPLYSFASQRIEDSEVIDPHGKDIVIIEGIFALSTAQMCKRLNTFNVYIGPRMYFDMIAQRIDRDTSGERGKRSPEDIRRLETTRVGPGFFQYVANTSNYAHIHLDNPRKESPEEGLEHCKSLALHIIENMCHLLPEKIEVPIEEKADNLEHKAF